LSEVIDTDFPEAEREGYLDEVREHLPAFLSEVAYGRAQPLQDVSALLNLRAQDLRRVIDTHLAFCEPIIRFVEALPDGLRHPVSSSTRPPVTAQSVRGPVDWAATFQARYQEGGNPALFVVRPPQRVFNTPENQALAWFLGALHARIESITPVEGDREQIVGEASWYQHIRDLNHGLTEAARHVWLRGVEPKRPTAQVIHRLEATRKHFYAIDLVEAIEVFTRYTERPSSEDITELLCQRYFEPRLNWQLFELTIALRLARAFENKLGQKRAPSRLLVGRAQIPFARYELDGGDTVQLWYQSWPDIETRSLLREARKRHNLKAGSTRPDFVVERRGETLDVVLLEVKASRNPRTLGAGLVQLLGYLKERPELWPRTTPGWLVAPASPAFVARSAEEEPLWMVDADSVAEASVERLLE